MFLQWGGIKNFLSCLFKYVLSTFKNLSKLKKKRGCRFLGTPCVSNHETFGKISAEFLLSGSHSTAGKIFGHSRFTFRVSLLPATYRRNKLRPSLRALGGIVKILECGPFVQTVVAQKVTLPAVKDGIGMPIGILPNDTLAVFDGYPEVRGDHFDVVDFGVTALRAGDGVFSHLVSTSNAYFPNFTKDSLVYIRYWCLKFFALQHFLYRRAHERRLFSARTLPCTDGREYYRDPCGSRT